LAVVAKLKIESRSHRELYQMAAVGFADGHAESSVSC
jgi:prepilin-type processing-associated H-X9-DG protein